MQAAVVGVGREQSLKVGLHSLNLESSESWDLAKGLSPLLPALQSLVLGRSCVNIC